MKHLRKNKLFATHMKDGIGWLEILDAGEPSGDAFSEVNVVPQSLADDILMP